MSDLKYIVLCFLLSLVAALLGFLLAEMYPAPLEFLK